ncbi:hypothetical protein [Rubrivirga sp.]|uniref:hypothetical protein n=1 Tax=Rubrivirga sp. TaxID=1885344 RepID=UPI003B51F744
MRPLALAAALLTVPALAQSDPAPLPEPTAPPVTDVAAEPAAEVESKAGVDSVLIGAWTLAEVAEGGRLGELGVEVENMTCAFDAAGTAHVQMEMVQDLEPLSHERTFAFETEDGQILVEDDDPVRYQILDDGRLQITTADGLVVRMVRTRP